MALMVWKEEFSVEVSQIDQQHKHLVGLLNGLHEVMSRGGDAAEVAALLQDLVAYTRFHFDFEEKLMERAGYTGLEAHREKHRAMKAEVERLRALAEAKGSSVTHTLMAFLKNWLGKHICGTDKEYVPTMHRAGIV